MQVQDLCWALTNPIRAKVRPTMDQINRDPLGEVRRDMVKIHQDTLELFFTQTQFTKIKITWLITTLCAVTMKIQTP